MVNASGLVDKLLAVLAITPPALLPTVIPQRGTLEGLIEELFWSSLDHYEGVPLRAKIYVAPLSIINGSDPALIALRTPVPANRENIRRLAPAHGRDGALVVVEREDQSVIVGTYASARAVLPSKPSWLCVECTGTGHFRIATGFEVVLEFSRGFERVLGGMSFDTDLAAAQISGALAASGSQRTWEIAHMYMAIARAIDRDGAGGALWLLPGNAKQGPELSRLGYPVTMSPTWADPFREEWEVRTSSLRMLDPPVTSGPRMTEIQWMAQAWDLGRRDAVCASLADLAKVDGAILANDDPEVLAFGVVCNRFETPARRVMVPAATQAPFSSGGEVAPSTFGGSRHRSAIHFCSSNAPAAAIVVSHDGGLSVFAAQHLGEVFGSRVATISSSARLGPA